MDAHCTRPGIALATLLLCASTTASARPAPPYAEMQEFRTLASALRKIVDPEDACYKHGFPLGFPLKKYKCTETIEKIATDCIPERERGRFTSGVLDILGMSMPANWTYPWVTGCHAQLAKCQPNIAARRRVFQRHTLLAYVAHRSELQVETLRRTAIRGARIVSFYDMLDWHTDDPIEDARNAYVAWMSELKKRDADPKFLQQIEENVGIWLMQKGEGGLKTGLVLVTDLFFDQEEAAQAPEK